MLEGFKDDDRPPDPRCLESREMPATFLRFESPREQVALPYSSLIKLELARDETALELFFVTHRVSVTGRKLAEIYHSVTDVQARLVRVVSNEFAGNPAVPTYRALVHGIRIDALDADERRKQ
jgi:hypothetical protein